MEPLSVVIITFNEEKNIGRCLDSVKSIANEIIVLDSFSTDATVQIALSKGAQVYQQKFAGYVAQKNKALEYASYNKVLCLDADEMLSAELIDSIKKAKKGFMFHAYSVSRCAYYRGRFIRHGTWYPERKIRLFDKRYLQWNGHYLHDKVTATPRMAVYPLKGDVLHFICSSKKEHRKRTDNFSEISAWSMYQRGRKVSWFKMMGSPGWFFLHDYILRAGFLSGWRGLAIAREQSRYHFLKYKKLRRLWKTRPTIHIYEKSLLNIQPTANADRLTRDVSAHV